MLENTLNVVGAFALVAAAFRSFKAIGAEREAEAAAREALDVDDAPASAEAEQQLLDADAAAADAEGHGAAAEGAVAAAGAPPVLSPEAAAARAEAAHWLQFWWVSLAWHDIVFLGHRGSNEQSDAHPIHHRLHC